MESKVGDRAVVIDIRKRSEPGVSLATVGRFGSLDEALENWGELHKEFSDKDIFVGVPRQVGRTEFKAE